MNLNNYNYGMTNSINNNLFARAFVFISEPGPSSWAYNTAYVSHADMVRILRKYVIKIRRTCGSGLLVMD